MTKVHCSVSEQYVNPLFEVFDGGDFVLSSWHDVESAETEMNVYLGEPSRAIEAARRLRDALELVGCTAEVAVSDVPDEDWKFAYRRHFRTEPVGRRLVVVPTWELEAFRASSDPALAGRIPVVLDPGMAFGTGRHETTRACLEYIDDLAPAAAFLDMGCGSGILSIAASKLGYGSVAAFDIDEDAVRATRENAALNGVAVDCRRFALGHGVVTLDETIEAAKGIYPDLALQGKGDFAATPPFAPADVVVANILGPLLIAFADEIAGYARSRLVLSGILDELYGEVVAAFAARGFGEVSRRRVGEWTTGLFLRNGTA